MDYEEIEPKVGRYAMHYMSCKKEYGTLVQITDDFGNGRFGIRYVPSGGASFSWPAVEFGAVTDPLLIAITRADDARQKQKYHEKQAQKRSHEAEMWEGVIECLKDANKNIKALP